MTFKHKALVSVLFLSLSGIAFAQSPVPNPGQSSGPGSGTGGIDTDIETHYQDMEKFLRDNDQKNIHAARKDFAAVFKEAQELLVASKTEKAKGRLDKLHKMGFVNKYEESRVYLLDYWYEGQVGNKEAETEALTKLIPIGHGSVDADAYVEAGIRLLTRQYNAQDFGSAIDTLKYLREEPKSQVELNEIAPTVQALDDIASGSKNVAQAIKISEKGVWGTKLTRSTFYLDKISGEVSSVDFNCANKQASLPYKADSVMSVPDAWGSCSIKINSKPYTTFNFVQLVNKPAA